MAHIGTLREYKFKGDVDDIRGANLYGRDNEKLGTIDDVVFDHAGGYIQYLVVDTGGWLSSNKFLVPADRVNMRDDNSDFTCDLTKDRIEKFPEYKDSVIRSHEDWDRYERRYRAGYEDSGGVLHREGSDHLITPDASELPAIADDVSGVSHTPQRLVDKFSTAEPRAEKTRLRPAGIAAGAEDASLPGNPLENEKAVWEEGDQNVRNRRATDKVSNVRGIDEVRSGESYASGIAGEVDNSGSAYGDPARQRVPELSENDPPSYRIGEDRDARAQQRYASNRRLADFEDSLRKNRVDITSSCRSCGVEKEEDAA